MPVVNYTNHHNTVLAEFVASHSSPNSEIYDLCFSTFQGVLGQPGLDATENCFVLERAGVVKGVALVFREFAISRSVIEVMTDPEQSGSLDELELVQCAVARAEAKGLGVAHICVLPESGRGGLLEQVGFSQVRTYLDMLWDQDELPDLELPQGYSVRSFQSRDTP